MALTRGSKRHAVEALPGIVIPGLASFLGLVAVGKLSDTETLGLVSLAWVTAVFGSAIVGFGPSQAGLRSVAVGAADELPMHRRIMVERMLVIVPAVVAVGLLMLVLGRATGGAIVLGALWTAPQAVILFESEALKARRDFVASSTLVALRAVAGWSATVTGLALSSGVVAAVTPQLASTAIIAIAMRPAIARSRRAGDLERSREISRPAGRLAVASYTLGYADRYVLEGLKGASSVGIYTLGYQLGEGLLEVVSAPVTSALLPRIVSEWNAGDARAAWRTARRGSGFLLIASGAAVPLIFAADAVGVLRLISDDDRLVTVAALVAVAVGLQGTTRLAYAVLLAQARAEVANRCFWQIVGVSAITVPALTFWLGLVGTAWATLVGYGLLSLLMNRAARLP